MKFTPVRVVCQNTLTQALARASPQRARHDRDLVAGLQDVTARHGPHQGDSPSSRRCSPPWRASGWTTVQLRRYLAKVFPAPADRDDERAWERVDARATGLRILFGMAPATSRAGVAGSLWAAYNGVAELLDHGTGGMTGPRAAANGRPPSAPGGPPRSLSPQRRLQSCWFGAGCRTKLRAWDEAMKMADARGEV